MTKVQYLEVEEHFAGQRLDNFLLARFKNVPKSHLYRIIRKGEVRVNKKRTEPPYRLQAGDLIRVPPIHMEETVTIKFIPKELVQELSSRIVYEDNHLLIINKPSGIAVHGGSGVKFGVIEILRELYPKLKQLELAHRLDSDTSGCLILAKKRSVLRELHELMREGKVVKKYLALTKGHWKKNELNVDAALKKNYLQSGERIVKVDNEEGKESQTIFSPIATYQDAMLMEATLITGRTHQIRVHAQYRKHPIAGDEKYGDKEFNKKMRERGLKRLFLHAKFVEFTLASIDLHVAVSAPLDSELENVLKNC